MTDLVVYGAGGMGAEVAEMVLACAEQGAAWRLVGFLDDDESLLGTKVVGVPVLGNSGWIAQHPGVKVALGIGHPRVRREVIAKLEKLGAEWATVWDPCCRVFPSARLGEGTVVFADCIVSSRAQLGRFVYLNYNAIVSHDAILGDNVCVMPNVAIAGNVRIGEGVFLGSGVSVRQGVTIGKWSLIGAGATVVENIPPYCVAVGVPARPLRFYKSPDEMPAF
ncbi:MAG: acetyltransferase [Candidatus Zipacnadales bacterium]